MGYHYLNTRLVEMQKCSSDPHHCANDVAPYYPLHSCDHSRRKGCAPAQSWENHACRERYNRVEVGFFWRYIRLNTLSKCESLHLLIAVQRNSFRRAALGQLTPQAPCTENKVRCKYIRRKQLWKRLSPACKLSTSMSPPVTKLIYDGLEQLCYRVLGRLFDYQCISTFGREIECETTRCA